MKESFLKKKSPMKQMIGTTVGQELRTVKMKLQGTSRKVEGSSENFGCWREWGEFLEKALTVLRHSEQQEMCLRLMKEGMTQMEASCNVWCGL